MPQRSRKETSTLLLKHNLWQIFVAEAQSRRKLPGHSQDLPGPSRDNFQAGGLTSPLRVMTAGTSTLSNPP